MMNQMMQEPMVGNGKNGKRSVFAKALKKMGGRDAKGVEYEKEQSCMDGKCKASKKVSKRMPDGTKVEVSVPDEQKENNMRKAKRSVFAKGMM